MNDIEVLEFLSKFFRENIASKIKLEKPSEDNINGKYELVNPAVYEGWVPIKNFLDNYGYDVPGIVVMIDEGNEDKTADLNIRIKIVTYDPGISDLGELTPNAKGYKDLLNLITLIRIELAQNPVILEKVSINKPFNWSMDEEQSYPYWSANFSFSVSIVPLAFNIEKSYEKYL